ncbi:MAG: Crp/Fnr family transcriptional regulator [Porticoccus sp.]|nr:Crp/Fnr family transcriptional regulator [Porticoccus sp.]
MPSNVRNKLLKRCTLVDWTFGDIVYEVDQIYEHVYFPVTGFISLLTLVDDHHPLEMGLVGNEGMLGVSRVLSVNYAPMRSIVQGTGTALSMTAEQFQRSLLDCPGLSTLLMRYIYVLEQQLVMAGACLHFHEIDLRLARWLLMTQDRSHWDSFYLTHAFLARMLGVRRSGVSIAAESLKNRHLIEYARGNIKILDRKGLEAVSCQCYQGMTGFYNRVMQ